MTFLRLLLLAFTFVAAPALAQTPGTWVFQSGSVFTGNPGISWMTQSVASPSVVYDTIRGRWFMVFESKTNIVDARCPAGVYALGAAVSSDGISWAPFTKAVVLPKQTSSTYYSCVAAQPTAVFSPTVYAGAGGLLVYFKAQQRNDTCTTGPTPTWGCAELTGIGRLQIQLDLVTGNIKTVAVQVKPAYQPTVATWGFPKLIQDKKKYRIAYQQYPDIYSLSSANPAVFTTAVSEVTKASGVVPNAVNEVFNPSLICADDPSFPFAMYVGGRDTNGALTVSGAWTKAKSASASLGWVFDVTPQNSWTTDAEWRHWEVTKLNTGEYLVWFDEKDLSGNNFIRFGGTNSLAFANNTAVSRACP